MSAIPALFQRFLRRLELGHAISPSSERPLQHRHQRSAISPARRCLLARCALDAVAPCGGTDTRCVPGERALAGLKRRVGTLSFTRALVEVSEEHGHASYKLWRQRCSRNSQQPSHDLPGAARSTLFWSRERITELRLATYDKVNGITAAIYMHESADSILGNMRSFQESPLSPMGELLALMTAHDEIRNRFSETALQAYKKLERLLESRGLPSANRVSYAAATAAVLEQLHTDPSTREAQSTSAGRARPRRKGFEKGRA